MLLQASNEVSKTVSETAADGAPDVDTVGEAFTTYGPWGLAIVAVAFAIWFVKRRYFGKPKAEVK